MVFKVTVCARVCVCVCVLALAVYKFAALGGSLIYVLIIDSAVHSDESCD